MIQKRALDLGSSVTNSLALKTRLKKDYFSISLIKNWTSGQSKTSLGFSWKKEASADVLWEQKYLLTCLSCLAGKNTMKMKNTSKYKIIKYSSTDRWIHSQNSREKTQVVKFYLNKSSFKCFKAKSVRNMLFSPLSAQLSIHFYTENQWWPCVRRVARQITKAIERVEKSGTWQDLRPSWSLGYKVCALHRSATATPLKTL